MNTTEGGTKPKRPKSPGSGMKKGYNAGGIRTLADLKLRCKVDPVSGCWRWLQAVITRSDQNTVAKVHMVHPVTGGRLQTTGRRAALILSTGKDLPRGHYAFPRPCCDHSDCVNPEHTRSGTREAHGKWVQKAGYLKGLPTYRAASRRRAKSQQILTPKQVAEIRRDLHVTIKEFARRFNCAQSVVWSARNYRTYTDIAVRASVFDLGGIAA